MTRLTSAERAAIGFWADGLKPHPDARPWAKCCGPCLMRPVFGASRLTLVLRDENSSGVVTDLIKENGRFYCVHRKDGDYHRECAGWARLFPFGR
jgi:hypothetical protein